MTDEENVVEEEEEVAEEEAPAMGMDADVAPADPRARVIKKVTRVYRAPNFDADVVGKLDLGDVVKIMAVSGVNVWVRIGPSQWVPFQAKGKQYLEMED
jgi:hypothetical protein